MCVLAENPEQIADDPVLFVNGEIWHDCWTNWIGVVEGKVSFIKCDPAALWTYFWGVVHPSFGRFWSMYILRTSFVESCVPCLAFVYCKGL